MKGLWAELVIRDVITEKEKKKFSVMWANLDSVGINTRFLLVVVK